MSITRKYSIIARKAKADVAIPCALINYEAEPLILSEICDKVSYQKRCRAADQNQLICRAVSFMLIIRRLHEIMDKERITGLNKKTRKKIKNPHTPVNKNIKFLMDVILMVIGATLTAFATKYVYDPAGLVTGGVSGLSIITRSVSARYFGYEVPLWMSNLLFNVPIFLYAMRVSGFRSVLRTGFVWLLMTVELFFFPEISYVPENLLLVAIYGSILMGVGSGLLLVARSTSGGSDMLGESLHHHIRSVSVGRLIQIIDGIIVAAGLLTFGVEHTLYAMISVYIMGKVIDLVLNNGKKAKMATIISDASDMIAKEIMTNLNRGVTGLNGTGMYTGADKKVLMCICSNKDIVDIKDIVKKYDPKAFFTVGDVSEAMGEGFVEEWAESA